MTAINEDVIKLVVARLSTLSPTVKISIGSEGSFTKEQLIKHVTEGDEVGRFIIDMHLSYLRAVTNQ